MFWFLCNYAHLQKVSVILRWRLQQIAYCLRLDEQLFLPLLYADSSAPRSARRFAMTAKPDTDLLFFYGDRCPFTKRVEPEVAGMEDELKTKLTRLEVWSNAENRAIYDRMALGKCQGGQPCAALLSESSLIGGDCGSMLCAVPFFINKKTEKFICGATTKDKLKAWAAADKEKSKP